MIFYFLAFALILVSIRLHQYVQNVQINEEKLLYEKDFCVADRF